MLGRVGDRFLLLGMLSYSVDGKPCLEDPHGSVELDFSKQVIAFHRIHNYSY